MGLSVIDKLCRSLGFRQTHLETYKSIIYDSYPWAPSSQTREVDVFLRLHHVCRPTKRGGQQWGGVQPNTKLVFFLNGESCYYYYYYSKQIFYL